MTSTVPALFEAYDWVAEVVEDGIWRSTFADDTDAEFDLYVADGGDWLHFAVSPLTPSPAPACRARLQSALLHLNQELRLVRFALDKDGDVALLADLPQEAVTFPLFAATLDSLIHYTRELGAALTRLATDPAYHSPLVEE